MRENDAIPIKWIEEHYHEWFSGGLAEYEKIEEAFKKMIKEWRKENEKSKID